jgi:hypothetical protein
MIDNTKDKEKYGDPLIWGVVGTLNTIIKELVKGDLPLKQYEINSTKNENGISVYKVALNKNRVCKIGSID